MFPLFDLVRLSLKIAAEVVDAAASAIDHRADVITEDFVSLQREIRVAWQNSGADKAVQEFDKSITYLGCTLERLKAGIEGALEGDTEPVDED